MGIKVELTDKGLIESKTADGTPSQLLVYGTPVVSGSGGGGGGSFPLDPVPTVGSVLIADADGNPTTSTDLAVTVTNSYGLTIASTTGYNKGINIISTSGYNQGINITSTTGPNYGLTISKTGAGKNQGINITQIAAGVNYGITISASGGATNNGLTITGGSGGVTVDGVNIVPLAINAHFPLVQSAHTSATKTLALADAQDIIPLSAASNAIEVTIPHTLFASGGTGRAFECRLRATSVAGGAITFVGSGGIVITYHGKNPGTTPIVAGDVIRVVVTSATSADVWVDAVAV